MSTGDAPMRVTDAGGDPQGRQDSDLGWAISIVSKAFARVATPAVADLPAGPRGYLALLAIAEGQASTQLALAHRLALDKTVITYLLDDLERAGLVERRPDPADRRARQVLLTPRGTRALDGTRGRLAQAEGLLLRPLDEQDATTLRRLLGALARGIQDDSAIWTGRLDADCD